MCMYPYCCLVPSFPSSCLLSVVSSCGSGFGSMQLPEALLSQQKCPQVNKEMESPGSQVEWRVGCSSIDRQNDLPVVNSDWQDLN